MEPTDLDSPVVPEPVAEPVAELVVEPVAAPVAATPVNARTEVSPLPAGPFHSLYQTFGGTLTAGALGMLIVVGIQIIVSRVFSGARTMSDSLTTFATSMVAILVAIYVCDLLIAGP